MPAARPGKSRLLPRQAARSSTGATPTPTTTTPLKVDEYKSTKKKKAPARKSSNGSRSSAPLPMTAVAALISADVPLRVRQDNPKGGASKARFERYMPAQSAREFVVLGGTKGDLQNDLLKGHVAPSCCRPRGPTRSTSQPGFGGRTRGSSRRRSASVSSCMGLFCFAENTAAFQDVPWAATRRRLLVSYMPLVSLFLSPTSVLTALTTCGGRAAKLPAFGSDLCWPYREERFTACFGVVLKFLNSIHLRCAVVRRKERNATNDRLPAAAGTVVPRPKPAARAESAPLGRAARAIAAAPVNNDATSPPPKPRTPPRPIDAAARALQVVAAEGLHAEGLHATPLADAACRMPVRAHPAAHAVHADRRPPRH